MMKQSGIMNAFNATAIWLLAGLFAPASLEAGEKVLFVSDRDEPGNYDLYSIDVDTQAVRRLTTDPGIDNHPDLSPDRTKVVWSSTRKKERPSDAAETNPEGDFEIFIANWSDTGYLDAPGGVVHQLTTDNSVANTHIPADKRNIPDRHPHFSPDGTKIIYDAKYVCVTVVETAVSECSVPRIVTITPCGRQCEGLRIMDAQDLTGDHVGDNLISIDHAALTAANPAVWPARVETDARWVGHPSFSHDGTKILFSGAVDGEGRNWEVYVADWNGATVSNLRQLTLGSTYPDNPNPIKMSAGAHFLGPDDSRIIFTSTRTELGNSQLFVLTRSGGMFSSYLPVSPLLRFSAVSDRANDYVPEPLGSGRILVTSDRDEYNGVRSCNGGPAEFSAAVDPGSSHTLRIEATGLKNAASAGTRIHLGSYALGGAIMEEDTGTAYSGIWTPKTSPNASGGYYMAAEGGAGEAVEIAIPIGTSSVRVDLGATPSSGQAQIIIDTALVTTMDLYTPQLSTSNDLDLILVNDAGTSQTNLTDNDFADEMLLIGDEVSWFCGLSPNLSECTYFPKTFTIGSFRLMCYSRTLLPNNFPNRDLYPLAIRDLSKFMFQNHLRPNTTYVQNVYEKMNNPLGLYDNDLIVLPAPVNYSVDNEPPSLPSNPGTTVMDQSVRLNWAASTDTDPTSDTITYDVYMSKNGAAMVLVDNDTTKTEVLVEHLYGQPVSGGSYTWRVVARDSRGGLKYGDVWNFNISHSGGALFDVFKEPDIDVFDSEAQIQVDLPGPGPTTLELAGPTIVKRSPLIPSPAGGGVIDTEIVALELTGTSPLGPIVIRESPVEHSTGQVLLAPPATDFAADSFFDIFTEISLGEITLFNKEPIRLEAPPRSVRVLPPLGVAYQHAGGPVPLYNKADPSGNPVATFISGFHRPRQRPSYSVAPGGPSGLDPATIYWSPTGAPVPAIPAAGLGLTPFADNLDALSYGHDPIHCKKTVFFSVGPAAVGELPSAVRTEATKSPPEAHGDEFVAYGVGCKPPAYSPNLLAIDESSPSLALAVGDDLDALDNYSPPFVDPDGNGVPNKFVYFSLAAGSASLGGAVTPDDILVTVGGAPFSIFADGVTHIGLKEGDDLDALCLYDRLDRGRVNPGRTQLPPSYSGDMAVFSLAPGSPSLAALGGASPADLFYTEFDGTFILFDGAPSLGLLASDNLNALKCPPVRHRVWIKRNPFRNPLFPIQPGIITLRLLGETIQTTFDATSDEGGLARNLVSAINAHPVLAPRGVRAILTDWDPGIDIIGVPPEESAIESSDASSFSTASGDVWSFNPGTDVDHETWALYK